MINAVLFDWRGTLVVPPTLEDLVREGLAQCGRTVEQTLVSDIVDRVLASNGPEDRLDTPGMDADAALHREVTLRVFAEAGIDQELATAMYGVECDWRRNPFAVDAGSTLRDLAAGGVAIGVVSDIHFDIRPAFEALGVLDLVASFTLSFEVGAQKPSSAMFTHALDAVGHESSTTLFVGDRSGSDGPAVEHGMTTLLLPPLRSPHDARLSSVCRLALG